MNVNIRAHDESMQMQSLRRNRKIVRDVKNLVAAEASSELTEQLTGQLTEQCRIVAVQSTRTMALM